MGNVKMWVSTMELERVLIHNSWIWRPVKNPSGSWPPSRTPYWDHIYKGQTK